MRLPRRAPREVYRLYDEEEYLAGATWEPSVELPDTEASADPSSSPDLRRRRMTSAAILVGAASAVGAVIALNTLHQSPRNGRGEDGRARSTRAKPTAAVAGVGAVQVIHAHGRTPSQRRSRPLRGSSESRRGRRQAGLQMLRRRRFVSVPAASEMRRLEAETRRREEFGFER